MTTDKANILLVDDQPGKLLSYQAVLADLDENLLLAHSGREALQCLLKEDVALILLDVVMPEMDGFELATMIRQHPRLGHTPIIFVTAYNTSDFDRLKGYELGAVDYVFAPIVPEILLAKVSVFVELHRKREELRALNRTLEQRVAERTAELEQALDSLELRVQERTARLVEANGELEAFSYSVSHDLRAPLRHVAGFVSLLEKRIAFSLDDTSAKYLQSITQAIQEAGTLVDDLLEFAQLSRTELQAIEVSMDELVAQVQIDLAPETSQRLIHWNIAELPTVQGDPSLLRLVLRNLMGNAVKYTRHRAEAQIEISCQHTDQEMIVFYVRDNGAGFDMHYVDKLFGVFQRLHRQEEFEGTGIGLANVRRIIHRHGGRTWAEGEVDHGATFYFSLPRVVSLRSSDFNPTDVGDFEERATDCQLLARNNSR